MEGGAEDNNCHVEDKTGSVLNSLKIDDSKESKVLNSDKTISGRTCAKWDVGDLCVAKWEEDQVWYNGVIESKNDSNSYHVKFVDYGNSDVVAEKYLVKRAQLIPPGQEDMIDENVVSFKDKPIAKKVVN